MLMFYLEDWEAGPPLATPLNISIRIQLRLIIPRSY